MPFCIECNIEIQSSSSHNRTRSHKENCCIKISSDIKLVKTAFKTRMVTYHISTNANPTDVKLYLESIQSKIILLVEKSLETSKTVKINFELYGLYLLAASKQHEVKSFNSQYSFVSPSTDLEQLFLEYRDILITKTSQFTERGSGWALVKLLFLELNINKFDRGGDI